MKQIRLDYLDGDSETFLGDYEIFYKTLAGWLANDRVLILRFRAKPEITRYLKPGETITVD